VEGMHKKSILGIALVSIVFLSLISGKITKVDTNDNLPIETWITNMTWGVYENQYESEISQFGFAFNFSIYNPNNESVTLYFSTSQQFDADFYAFLENSNHNVSRSMVFVLPVLTERTLEPGITQDSTGFILNFDTENLTVLPNGDYIFWIYALDNPSIVSHWTSLTMIDGEPIIDFYITPTPTPPSTPPTIPITQTSPTQSTNIGFVLTGISTIVIFLYLEKKRKKASKN
jgi:hypothetical protein